MKTTLRDIPNVIIAIAAGLLAVAPAANLRADIQGGPDTTSSTTENSTGTVINVLPGRSITVDSRRGPFTYRLEMEEELDVLGPDGRHISAARIRRGSLATVYYHLRDGAQTVNRIVILSSPRGAGK